ncbi:MAG: TolC family protein [Thiobacillaceae bacterium]
MRGIYFLPLLLLSLAQTAQAADKPLTLSEALAAADTDHPDLALAESDLAASLADRNLANSRQDFNLFLDGSLRAGKQPGADWEPDNIGRVVARKTLLDFGRSEQTLAAADQEVVARRAALFDTRAARRIDLMARFFDVLLADQQYAADNEFMTVAYLMWDNARDRFALGQLTRPQLLELEARFQDLREQRNASLQRLRSTRQKLANAMSRPGNLPVELAQPTLPGNEQPLPEYEALLPGIIEHNPALRGLDAQINASDARIGAIRAERRPTLDAEVLGAGYSRASSTRDQVSAGLLFNVPLYQGGRIDARAAREQELKSRLLAQREKLKLGLNETVLDTLHEIEWLRSSGRPAADKQIEYRDWALERSRAEYELEMKTNLGTSLAETQTALLRQKRIEYRLALALARLAALSGELPGSSEIK